MIIDAKKEVTRMLGQIEDFVTTINPEGSKLPKQSWFAGESMQVYIRKWERRIDGTRKMCVDVIKAFVDEPYRGQRLYYDTFLTGLENITSENGFVLFIENVFDERQHHIYLTNGFDRLPNGNALEPCFFKRPVKKEQSCQNEK